MTDRFRAAATEWGDDRFMSTSDALEAKAEQALVEIEHLASGGTEATFDIDPEEGIIRHEPSEGLANLLAAQAAESGVDEATVMQFYVDLFSRAFLDSDVHRPSSSIE